MRLAPLKPRSLVEASSDSSELGFGTMGRTRVAQRRKEAPIRFAPWSVRPSKGASVADLKRGWWRMSIFFPRTKDRFAGAVGLLRRFSYPEMGISL